jgi:hypothetical protein
MAKLFDWRGALITVRLETLIGWHRKGFKLLYRWKSKAILGGLPHEYWLEKIAA